MKIKRRAVWENCAPFLLKTVQMKNLLNWYFVLLLIILFVFSSVGQQSNSNLSVPIHWVESINSDFSFKNKWNYPIGVYCNKWGQLSCDGICPLEIDAMKDENGRIFTDSLKAFYQVIDTTHLFHSIESETNAYEWTGTDFINIEQSAEGDLFCETVAELSTHSSLSISINGDSCSAIINFGSISPEIGNYRFPLKGGKIKIDKSAWKQNILKAEFDFLFTNLKDSNQDFFWRGKIYRGVN